MAVLNEAHTVTGLQIGLINYAQNLRGVQIGLLNIHRNGLVFFPIINIGFGGNEKSAFLCRRTRGCEAEESADG